MKGRKWIGLGAAPAVLATLVLVGWTYGGSSAAAPRAPKLDNVTLQLKWVTQSQFAGYYAAAAKGYYKQFGLNVKIKVGGPNITPEQVVVGGQAQFGIDWLPSLMATRDQGGNIVNIAQVFTRSGMTELTWKDSGITSIAQMKGKKVGVWCCGNQFELFAALTKNGIDPNDSGQVKIVNQPFDMTLFLSRQVDAAAAMTYNELAQVLETTNPKTGKLYTLKDLNVIKMEAAGTGMLEDGVFVRGDWISNAHNQDVAKRFLAASFKGWIYCRDHLSDCTNIVLNNGPTLGRGHQTWQMNEINALIWPTRYGIGVMDPTSYNRTASIAFKFKVIKKPASAATYRTDLAKAANAMLKKQKADIFGRSWKKAVVKVTPKGE